ncbi:MAG TPA: hypothetical protein VK066_19325 [Chloroflexota bacterium]|nr:hypothetical protein [Chloroflexota bacterium]
MSMPWDRLPELAAQAAPAVEQQVYQAAVERDLMGTVVAALVQEAIGRVEFPRPAVGGELMGAALGALGRALQTEAGGLAVASAEQWLAQSPAAATLRDAALNGVKRYLDENGAHLLDIVVQATAARLTAQQ